MRNSALLILHIVVIFALAGCATTIKPPKGVRPVERQMVTTGYCKCGECCNWKRTWYGKPVIKSGPAKGERKDIGRTASGTKGHKGTIAADTSRYPFGTVMYVPGYGYGRVEDRGSGVNGDHIDLFFNDHKPAMAWGRKTLPVRVWMAR